MMNARISGHALDAATEYARGGVRVFPLVPRSKRPASPHGFLDASTEGATLRAWFERHPERGLGAATGAVSGVFVLDVDPPEGFATLATLELRNGSLPTTATAATGRGGLHLWFSHPGGGVRIPTRAGQLGEGLDIRGDGGCITLPPTIHATGRRYVWLRGLDELADAPRWLLTLVVARPRPPRQPLPPLDPSRARRYGAAALAQETARVASAGEGARNATTNAAAFSLGQLVAVGDLAESVVGERLIDAAIRAGLPEREACAAVRCGLRAGMKSPRRCVSP